MKKQWRKWGIGICFVLFSGVAVPANAMNKMVVFAAASLTNALQDIATQYQQETGEQVMMSFASSSTLARQIQQGAPADLFISADQQWMNYVIDQHQMVDSSRYTLLGNNLVVITAASSQQKMITINKKTDWLHLLNGGRLAVGDPSHVPAGIYAKEALQHLGVWTTLIPKLAPASDVRGAMALVAREEAPLGIVYGSDARVSSQIKVIGRFPADSHKPVEYPMAIVQGHQTPAVIAFYRYLKGPEAAAIFKRYGFTVPT